MPKLLIGMGLPGSGKSTVLEGFAHTYGYDFISLDEIRARSGLSAVDPSTSAQWDEVRERALEGYLQGRTVVIDGTFLGSFRKNFIDYLRRNGIEKIQGVFMDTPAELAWEKNMNRDRKTPREAFDIRLQSLETFPIEMTDGFDALFVLNERGELKEAQIPKEGIREQKRERKFL